MKEFKISVFIFRRDLRLYDNTALLEACECSDVIIPIFIFDPVQVRSNEWFSINSFQFMLESLDDLEEHIHRRGGKLTYLYGSPSESLKKVLKIKGVEAVFMNRDYTPFSKERDRQIEELCEESGVSCRLSDDVVLQPPASVMKADGSSYQVFTAYYNKSRKLSVPEPQNITHITFYSGHIEGSHIKDKYDFLPTPNGLLFCRGGRTEALKRLKGTEKLSDYAETRNLPAIDGTSQLSGYLKFGNLSIREVFYHMLQYLSAPETFIRQLYWRDFYYQVAWHYPHVFGEPFKARYQNVSWENDEKKYEAWCEGKTGFPLVDAGMRQLRLTGFMHNRVRMVAASFLIKDLHIDWRWGEKYFASCLIDYDPAINNGNWQWCASTGCDAQPYFRIFNPWLQQKKHDPEAVYIKRWLPELAELSAKEIHRAGSVWDVETEYPMPIVDHDEEKDRAIDFYSSD